MDNEKEVAIAALENNTHFGWVIEHRDSEVRWPLYWTGKRAHQGCVDGEWSRDHMDAMRFMRQQDADIIRASVLGGAETCHRIAEHGWYKQ